MSEWVSDSEMDIASTELVLVVKTVGDLDVNEIPRLFVCFSKCICQTTENNHMKITAWQQKMDSCRQKLGDDPGCDPGFDPGCDP